MLKSTLAKNLKLQKAQSISRHCLFSFSDRRTLEHLHNFSSQAQPVEDPGCFSYKTVIPTTHKSVYTGSCKKCEYLYWIIYIHLMKTLRAVCYDIKLPGMLAITHAVHYRQLYNGNGGTQAIAVTVVMRQSAHWTCRMAGAESCCFPAQLKENMQPSSQTQPEFKHEGPHTKDLALPFINNTAKLSQRGHNGIQNFACHSRPP